MEKFAEVSEQCASSIFRVEEYLKMEVTLSFET
jgi:hypothetical protein